MAKDVITRFKLESTQYDSKIKNAAKELSDVAKAAKSAGSDFERFTKDQLAAARALGTIATSSTNAKDKAKELVTAFNDVARSYNKLTDTQKKSDFGKAVADSLTTLQQRIRETKQEVQSMESKSGGLFGGDKLSGMLQVMGGNLMTKGVTIAAGAVTSMVNEIGDAVKQGIELAKAGEGIRIAFERLGRGDILDGLREATHGTVTDLELMKAAVKFNDFKLPVEELGTMLAFAQQKAKDTGQSVDYMVDSIVTGLGRKSLMILDNLGLSAAEIKDKMKDTGDMTKAVGQIIREQMAKAGDYVETAADRAAQANVSLQNKMEELGRKFAPLEEASNQLWTSMKIGILDIVGGPLTELLNGLTEAGRLRNMLGEANGEGTNTKVGGQLGKLRVSKAAGSGYMTRTLYSGTIEEYNRQITKADELLQQFEKNHSSVNVVLQNATKQFGRKFSSISELESMKGALAAMREEYKKGAQEIMNSSKATAAVVGTTGGGRSGKGGNKTAQTELQQNQAEINRLTQEYVRLGDMSTQSAEERKAAIQDEIEKLKKRNGILEKYAAQAQGRFLLQGSDISMEGLKNAGGSGVFEKAMEQVGKEIEIKAPLQLDDKAMKAVMRDVNKGNDKKEVSVGKEIGNIAGGISSMVGGLEQLGIELPEGLKGVIGGIQTVTSILSGIMSVVVAIEAIAGADALIPFARGGIVPHAAGGYFVPGTKFSGDTTPILANAGEVVLNRAQVGNLASQLQGGGFSGMNMKGVLKGENILISVERTLKRKGRGELVTWG